LNEIKGMWLEKKGGEREKEKMNKERKTKN
jgi:hypothetical protein